MSEYALRGSPTNANGGSALGCGAEDRTRAAARGRIREAGIGGGGARAARARTTAPAPLAGGQTLINVMKARAASPDMLVDLNGLEELRGDRSRRATGRSRSARWRPTRRWSRSAEAKARPILGEVCATIADVQVRNRGTIGGNVCSNDPTNHLPPLMVAVGAQMTVVGAGRRARGAGGGVLPRRVHHGGGAGRAAHEGHASRRPAGTASPR